MNLVLRLITGLFLGAGFATFTMAADLVVDVGNGQQRYTTDQLLAHSQIEEIVIPNDVAYNKVMTYQALPMAALLKGMSDDAHLQALALDGFAADMPALALASTDPDLARAWLAIEDPARPWPKISDAKGSAGPFYLVWTNPAASGIVPEQWPYQIASIKRVGSIEERYPAMVLGADVNEHSPVRIGWSAFRTNCMVCHTINGNGDARVGPDLTKPFSPTEYMQPDYLRLYIRNPQALRWWPQAKMPAFSRNVLSDAELDGVIAYMKYMAQRR